MNDNEFEKFTEHIYLDDNGNIMYTSKEPLKYEDQTDCVIITCYSQFDLDRVLDTLCFNVGKIGDGMQILKES